MVICLKVHLTPKYFFHSNKSLHLFETHCVFLPLFNPHLDFLQAVKDMKPGHHPQVRNMGVFLVRCHKLLYMHVYKDSLRCKSV